MDWPSLLAAIDATGAGEVWVTHGYTAVVVRWLQERGGSGWEDRAAARMNARGMGAEGLMLKRAGLFTDYTFGIGEGSHLVPFAKA